MSVSYYLDQSNIDATYPDGQNFLQVTISDDVNGNIDFVVQTLAPLSSNAGTNYGIDSFGFNTPQSVSLANISGPAGWTLQTTQNQDGFGNFTDVVNTTGQNRADPLMFSITGIIRRHAHGLRESLNRKRGRRQHVLRGACRRPHYSYPRSQAVISVVSTPVPEADTYAMLLAGLGLVGFAVRRKLA